MSARIAILDYGMGNLRSVEKALERAGAEVMVTDDAEVAADAEGLVLPGVGAFARAMARVRELGFDGLIKAAVERGTPVLGICLGFQLIFERSNELAETRGLGLVAGDVAQLEAPGVKLPHIGWEPVAWREPSPLVEGIADRTPFYFVHGYAPRPAADVDILGVATHGAPFACAIARPPLFGVQFHPEKSSAAGLRLLANFTAICARAPQPA